MAIIYIITQRSAWDAAKEAGTTYVSDSLESEGFIHLSKRDQILRVANKIFTGMTDLVLLCIDEDKLTAELKYEDPAHPNPDDPVPTDESELFPHLYGELNLDAVVKVVDFPTQADGSFVLPDDL